jgi:hypothetical protein
MTNIVAAFQPVNFLQNFSELLVAYNLKISDLTHCESDGGGITPPPVGGGCQK